MYVDSTGVRAHQPAAEAGKGAPRLRVRHLAGCRRVDVCPGEALSRSGDGVNHHAAPGRRSGLLSPLHPRRAASPRPSAHPPERADRKAWRARQGARGGQSRAFERKVYR